MITGRYAHEIGTWDNAFPYTGVLRGWGRHLQAQGVHLATTGKLDFQPGVDHGVAEERMPMHRESLDIHSLFREEEILPRYMYLHRLRAAGPAPPSQGHSRDTQVAQDAARWLREGRPSDRPWVLVVNFNHMHQWTPPKDLWDHYDPLVKLEDLDERYFEDLSRLHPYQRIYTRHCCGDLMTLEEVRRGIAGYHGMCEAADREVGRVLEALDETGLREETLVVYGSDHGGSLGAHRNLDYADMYETSIRVPLIVAGPGVREGAAEATPVSTLDVFPTLCEAAGRELPAHTRGTSLWGLVQGRPDAPRPAFTLSEYHGAGFPASLFALRSGRYKFVECVGERPMLFDLEADPLEMHNLMLESPGDPGVKATAHRLRRMLCEVCSPEAVDARARSDQRRLRQDLRASGRLVEEMWRRGYERDPDRLIHRPEERP
jgi:choline-sulfatase